MEKGKKFENILLTEVHSGGRAIGYIGEKRVFVNSGVPGDVVDVVLNRKERGFRLGDISEIKEPSLHRIKPICKHFGICGGCNWQHIAYKKQLELKRNILVNALKKYDIRFPELPETVSSENTEFYRNKVDYAFSVVGLNSKDNSINLVPVLGFHPVNRPDKVLDIEECFLQKEPSRSIYQNVKEYATEHNFPFYNFEAKSGSLRSLVIRTSTTGEVMVIVGFTDDEPLTREKLLNHLLLKVPEITSLHYTVLSDPSRGYMDGDIICYGNTKPYMIEKSGKLVFRISPKSFYQPNPQQANVIFNKIVEFADFRGTELVYDLYTGVGTIACSISKYVNKVIGIEGSVDAINDAKENAILNKLTNLEFLTGDILETFTPEFVNSHGKPDVVILDPPRSGTLIEIKKTIISSGPEKIIYLSCNPVSLAWDLKQLTEKYKVIRIQPFDMFPHTHHVETLVLLEKND
jgi:23S rRNA (uracil1939-C5)-methyltransferase